MIRKSMTPEFKREVIDMLQANPSHGSIAQGYTREWMGDWKYLDHVSVEYLVGKRHIAIGLRIHNNEVKVSCSGIADADANEVFCLSEALGEVVCDADAIRRMIDKLPVEV
jgi:hypothetical protein